MSRGVHRVAINLQDGYAVSLKDGVGEFEVDFEATAGTAQKRLTSGKVAYIGTGDHAAQTSSSCLRLPVAWRLVLARHALACFPILLLQQSITRPCNTVRMGLTISS